VWGKVERGWGGEGMRMGTWRGIWAVGWGDGSGGWRGVVYSCKATQEMCNKYYYLGTSERS